MQKKTDPNEQMTPLQKAYLVIEKLQSRLEGLQRQKNEPIAIIGMACRFPGAQNLGEFWHVLVNGVDAISTVPPNRWNSEDFYDANPDKPGKMTTRKGGFIKDVEAFDAQFFGISPREASSMDPQQRILLELTWEALENAGLPPDQLAGSATGVFVGISSNDYALLPGGDLSFIDAYAGTGNSFTIAANRISYSFDFRGPSLAVDTACSSSLVSTHLACSSLRNSESSLAIACGVNLILAPDLTIAFSHARMMSLEGRCKSFDASADGYVRGEGCGVIVLKRLSDAIRAGDRIYAVIRGSAVNQDGRSNGLTAPNGLAQVKVLQQAYKNAQIDSNQLQYIEAHGTGTILGDPIEVQALATVMQGRSAENPCLIGSVKTNVGHLESAAGIAGIIKTALALHRKKIPPHLHFKKWNPHIPFQTMPFEIPLTLRDWPEESKKPLLAGISSFGFGGTNAHIVMENAPISERKNNQNDRPVHLLTLSARDEEALRNLARKYVDFCETTPPDSLADLCYTTNQKRTHFPNRVAIPADSTAHLKEGLMSYLAGEEVGYAAGHTQKNRIAFFFTGQGAQYVAMGKALYESQPVFRQTLDECAALLASYLDRPLLDLMFQSVGTDLLDQTQYTQPALFAIEYGLAKLWQTWGIQPDYLMGHSIGEYAAACFAGVFSLDDALKLVAARGRLMGSLPQDGEMAVIFAPAAAVKAKILPYSRSVGVAALNGPSNTVISGKRQDIAALCEQFAAEGTDFRSLKVSHAFHSPLMDPILEEFEAVAREVEFHEPRIPIVSNVDGKMNPGRIMQASYWRDQIRAAVQFMGGVETLVQHGCNVFLELGPNPHMTGMARRNLPELNAVWLPSLKQDQDDWQTLVSSLGVLYSVGAAVSWPDFDGGYSRYLVDAPCYAFHKEKYWYENLPERRLGSQTLLRTFQPEEEKFIEVAAAGSSKEQSLTREALMQISSDERSVRLTDDLRKRIARVLRLPIARVDAHRAITSLGLDSIMAIELKNTIERAFEINLPIARLIQGISTSELADLLLQGLSQSDSYQQITRETVSEVGDFPLSPGQKAMWVQHQLAPSSIFNPSFAFKIRTPLDALKLKQAFQSVVDRHPALRTVFIVQEGVPVQRVLPQGEIFFQVVDASTWSDGDLEKVLNRHVLSPFDLEKGPLLKIFLYDRSRDEQVLYFCAHHIVVDLWSQVVIINEVSQNYATADNRAQLPPLQIFYSDFVHWQSQMLDSDEGEKHWIYWQNQLKGELPVLNLPLDKPRGSLQTFNGRNLSIELGEELTAALKVKSTLSGTTLFTTLLSAFQVLLHRYTGQRDIIVGTPTTGRSRAELAESIGYFVNPVAMRATIDPKQSFERFLQAQTKTVSEALQHQDYPFYTLVERLHPARDLSRTPIFQVMFVYQRSHLLSEEGLSSFALGIEGSQMSLEAIDLESLPIEEQVAPFDITLLMAERTDGLHATITFNRDLFAAETILRFLSHFKILLQGIGDSLDQSIAQLPLLSETESQLVLSQWNDTQKPLPERQCIHELFVAQAQKTPDAIAVFDQDEQLTYAELDAKSNQMARHLRKQGVGTEDLVGLAAERSVDLIIGLLGILKAGGTYLPLDPDYPGERLRHMIQDSGLNLILTHKKLSAFLPSFDGHLVYLDRSLAEYITESSDPIENNVLPDNLAYVIYTSGSTGAPKGVMLSHRGLCNLVLSQIESFQVKPGQKVLQYASLNFDASLSEIFMALAGGASLMMAKRSILSSAPELLNLLRNAQIDVITLPPSLLKILPPEQLPGLKTIVSAGESCSTVAAERWLQGRYFVNAYGPTETTIGAADYKVKVIPEKTAAIPIGRPYPNVRIYIVDSHMNPVPIGVAGELCIGGIGLARGYRNRTDLTAEKFIPDPFSTEPGQRLYRSGDLARYLPDGNIEFIERIDDQVKIRGHRIELGEIESVLTQHPAVKQAVVTAPLHRNGSEDRTIVAYWVAKTDSDQLSVDFRSFLRGNLPDYMLPAHFVKLREMPLNANGKIDLRALPVVVREEGAHAAKVKPRNEVERQIAEVWQRVLKIDHVGVHDNFFDLGGHSLSLMQIQIQLKEVFNRDISAVDMFTYPTVSSMANFLNDDKRDLQQHAAQDRAQRQMDAVRVRQARMSNRRRPE